MEEQNINMQTGNTEFRQPAQEFVAPPGSELVPDLAPAPAMQEKAPANREGANQNSGMTLPPVVPQPISNTPDPQSAASISQVAPLVIDPNPPKADDVDVIEKEWVDKARKIVEQSKDDPYRQELEVGKLQIDYMNKRYGREIKPGSTSP
ncbi:hypothetical protein KBB17_00750 [Candidatus Saccharibacteria bacterium]|jgi:hypothetical protein|nr:hypothetical protein [Candidatus Saccharibacteria bacterium]MBP9131544.1 hypothetical protein [Candidatus Saccharibacteria bacterium]